MINLYIRKTLLGHDYASAKYLLRYHLFFSILLVCCPSIFAQSNSVIIDHSTARVYICTEEHAADDNPPQCTERKVFRDDVLYVDRRENVTLKVINTNTALYDYTFSTKQVADPAADSLQRFLSTATPYALDIVEAGIASLSFPTVAPVAELPVETIVLGETPDTVESRIPDDEQKLIDKVFKFKLKAQRFIDPVEFKAGIYSLKKRLLDIDKLSTIVDSTLIVRKPTETRDRLLSLREVEFALIRTTDVMVRRPGPTGLDEAKKLLKGVGPGSSNTPTFKEVEKSRYTLETLRHLSNHLAYLTRDLSQVKGNLSELEADKDFVDTFMRLRFQADSINAEYRSLSGRGEATLVEFPPLSDRYAIIIKRAEEAINDAPKLLQRGAQLETASRRILEAETEWKSEGIRVGFEKGKLVTLSVAPRENDEFFSRAAFYPKTDISFKAISGKWRPTVGLASVLTLNGEFSSFNTETIGDEEIVRRRTEDQTIAPMLGLGLFNRGRRFAFGPVILLNPLEDQRAIGTGVGMIFKKYVRFDGGVVWHRQQRLTDSSALPGEIVTLERGLVIDETYQWTQPRVFFGIAIASLL
jgi:hypothetical protein